MRKIVAGLMITVDGVYENQEKWSVQYQSPEFGQAIGRLMMDGDTLLLGRKTFEYFEGEFADQSGGEADMMNNLPKFVVSNTLKSVGWHNSTLIEGASLKADLSALKAQEGANVNVSGSGTLVRSLLRQGLLDELHLFVFPLVAGNGADLFDEMDSEIGLRLESSEALPNGVLRSVYSYS